MISVINLWQGNTSDIGNIIRNKLSVNWKSMQGARSLYVMRPGIAFIENGKK